MKKPLNLLTVVVLISFSLHLLAQTKTNAGNKTATSKRVKPNLIYGYLGHSNLRDGKISKKVFDSLLKQGITAKDSLGVSYKLDEFVFSYGERALYEDSVGNPIILTDMLQEYCLGDTITPILKQSIFKRTKPGDTAYLENIKVQTQWGQMPAKSMRLILTK